MMVGFVYAQASICNHHKYDTVYLMCIKILTCSHLSPAHGTYRRIKERM